MKQGRSSCPTPITSHTLMKPTEKQALGSQEKAVLESWKGKWEEESIALIRFITILNVRIRLKKISS